MCGAALGTRLEADFLYERVVVAANLANKIVQIDK